MKKTLAVVVASVLLFFAALPTFAESSERRLPNAEKLEERISEVEDAVPESVREYGLTKDNISDFLELKNIFSLLLSALKSAFSSALVPFFATLALLVALYLLNGILPDRENALTKTLCAVFAFGSVCSTFVSVFDAASSLRTAISEVCAFGQSLFPVLLSCVAASGRTACAAASSVGTGVLFSSLSFVGSEVVVPCVNTFFALGVTSSVLSNGALFTLSKTLKKLCVSVLGICSLLFSLCVGARGILAASADASSVRVAAYAVGNGIPFVGGSIAESMSAVVASAEAVAKSVGVFGSVCVVAVLFAPLVSVGVLWTVSAVLGAASEMLRLDGMRRFFSVVGDACSIIAALAAGVGVLCLISIGLVM